MIPSSGVERRPEMGEEHIHFIGIGGAGMAPLAELLLARGVKVSGSDLEFNEKCAGLAAAGAMIFVGHRKENLADSVTRVVYTSAASDENPELMQAKLRGIPQSRRGEYLARFAANYKRVIAVSGTHGKSSISTLIVTILKRCGFDPGYMIGAAIEALPSCSNGSGDDIFVTEADESDGTHTALKSFIGVVPNVEDDHAWSLGGKEVLEENFRKFAANSEHLVYYASAQCDRLFDGHPDVVRLADMPAEFAGLHGFQAANSFIASQAAIVAGAPENAVLAAAAFYPQVKRRMTVHLQEKNCLIIEDYAHHPTEVRCCLELLRMKYPDHRLCVVFQPHRYARLERYFDEFVSVLSGADICFVAPVFAAWCEQGRSDSRMLAGRCNGIALEGSWQEMAEKISDHISGQKLLVAILGAGDVEALIEPLKSLLSGNGR